jgi:hypothetical protein
MISRVIAGLGQIKHFLGLTSVNPMLAQNAQVVESDEG